MTDFVLEIQGVNELKRALRDYPKISEPILQKAIVATQFVMTKNTLKDNPVPYRTGNLLQSFRYQIGRLQARWTPTARYAPFVEFGTRPHPIFPVNARVLAWQKGGIGKYVTAGSGRRYYKTAKGTMVFAAHVNHPGTKPHPFMSKIAKKSVPEVSKLFKSALDLINQQIARQTKI